MTPSTGPPPVRSAAEEARMDPNEVYDLVYDAVIRAIADGDRVPDARMLRRFEGGKVTVEDGFGKVVKEIPIDQVFKKVTSVRDKLRVLEQKLNASGALSQADKAELQGYLSRAYGSLTTFNFLFASEADKFQGTGS
jgi:ASC-1-like (ASCH) protein